MFEDTQFVVLCDGRPRRLMYPPASRALARVPSLCTPAQAPLGSDPQIPQCQRACRPYAPWAPPVRSHCGRACVCPYGGLAALRGLGISRPQGPGAGEQENENGRCTWWPRGRGPQHANANLIGCPGEPRIGLAERSGALAFEGADGRQKSSLVGGNCAPSSPQAWGSL